MKEITGEAVMIGDHVDTDAIIPARYCTSIDPEFLGLHLLEGFGAAWKSRPGLILVAGRNFGCGSAREHAVLAIRGAGIRAVIAQSFSRTFFRNAINIALPVLELQDANEISAGDSLSLQPAEGRILNLTNGKEYKAQPYSDVVRRIFESGGLVEYARKKLAAKADLGAGRPHHHG